jgi:hypothetical protein
MPPPIGFVGALYVEMPVPPKGFGGHGACCVCSAVSYFSTLLGSIIGAGRLSFRVRDGSGRFPVAITAVTLCKFVGGGVQWLRCLDCGCVCVSFRPVSASSLHPLPGL